MRHRRKPLFHPSKGRSSSPLAIAIERVFTDDRAVLIFHLRLLVLGVVGERAAFDVTGTISIFFGNANTKDIFNRTESD